MARRRDWEDMPGSRRSLGRGPGVGQNLALQRDLERLMWLSWLHPQQPAASFCRDSKIPSPYSSAQDPTWTRVPLELRSRFLPLPLPLSRQPHFAVQKWQHSSFSGHLHFFLPSTYDSLIQDAFIAHSFILCDFVLNVIKEAFSDHSFYKSDPPPLSVPLLCM